MAQRSSCCIRVLAGLCVLFCIIHVTFNIVVFAMYNDLTGPFQHTFMGITIALCALIFIIMLYGFYATSAGQDHHIPKFRIITAIFMVLLFVSGLLHIIGQVNDGDFFYGYCLNDYQDPYGNYLSNWQNQGFGGGVGVGGYGSDQYGYCQMIFNALLATYTVIWVLHLLILFALILCLCLFRPKESSTVRERSYEDRETRSGERDYTRDANRSDRHESGGIRSMRNVPTRQSILTSTPAANRVKPSASRETRDRDGRVRYSTLRPETSTRQNGIRGVTGGRTRAPFEMNVEADEEVSIDLNDQTRREYTDYVVPESFSGAEAPSPESGQLLSHADRSRSRDEVRRSRTGDNTVEPLTRESRYSSRYATARG